MKTNGQGRRQSSRHTRAAERERAAQKVEKKAQKTAAAQRQKSCCVCRAVLCSVCSDFLSVLLSAVSAVCLLCCSLWSLRSLLSDSLCLCADAEQRLRRAAQRESATNNHSTPSFSGGHKAKPTQTLSIISQFNPTASLSDLPRKWMLSSRIQDLTT
jgi:hypothetical protein